MQAPSYGSAGFVVEGPVANAAHLTPVFTGK